MADGLTSSLAQGEEPDDVINAFFSLPQDGPRPRAPGPGMGGVPPLPSTPGQQAAATSNTMNSFNPYWPAANFPMFPWSWPGGFPAPANAGPPSATVTSASVPGGANPPFSSGNLTGHPNVSSGQFPFGAPPWMWPSFFANASQQTSTDPQPSVGGTGGVATTSDPPHHMRQRQVARGKSRRSRSRSSSGSRSRSRSRSPRSRTRSRSPLSDSVRLSDSEYSDFERQHRRRKEASDDTLSAMRKLRRSIREILPDCPPPVAPKQPHVRPGVSDQLGQGKEVEASKSTERAASKALPVAPVVLLAWSSLEDKLLPDGSVNLEARLEAQGYKETPLLKPGPNNLRPGRFFTSRKPPIESYRPSYYELHDASPIDPVFKLKPAAPEPTVKDLMGTGKPVARVAFRELEAIESLSKQSAAICSYQDWMLSSLASHLKGAGDLDDTTSRLLQSLGLSISHNAQLTVRVASNTILHRRDAVLKSRPGLDESVANALRALPLGGSSLFNDQLTQGLAVDQRLASLKMKPPPSAATKPKGRNNNNNNNRPQQPRNNRSTPRSNNYGRDSSRGGPRQRPSTRGNYRNMAQRSFRGRGDESNTR